MRYIGFRHKQAAGHAAAGAGLLTRRPGIWLNVSAPGFLNGLVASAEHAQDNDESSMAYDTSFDAHAAHERRDVTPPNGETATTQHVKSADFLALVVNRTAGNAYEIRLRQV